MADSFGLSVDCGSSFASLCSAIGSGGTGISLTFSLGGGSGGGGAPMPADP